MTGACGVIRPNRHAPRGVRDAGTLERALSRGNAVPLERVNGTWGRAERVPEATWTGGADEFASLLRELKDRSGLSYGALAKRLHMSTSTLHRYCNGTAVPHEYAPAERLARVCRATPQELMELHRRWILADAGRRSRPEQA